MSNIIDTSELQQIICSEFPVFIEKVIIPFANEIRIYLKDESFIDIWFSIYLTGRYSYHWERKHIDNSIFRHDNAPHLKWKSIATFPKHFHNKIEENVEASFISDEPEKAIREIMNFVVQKLYKE